MWKKSEEVKGGRKVLNEAEKDVEDADLLAALSHLGDSGHTNQRQS